VHRPTTNAREFLGLVITQVLGDEATRSVLERVNASGRFLLTHTVVNGRYLIRVAIGGLYTERRHVEALWEELQAACS